MKTIKTSITNFGMSIYIKALIIGTIVSVAITAIGMCLVALILLIAGVLPKNYIVWFMIGICVIASFVGGYVAARITKEKGMLIGAIEGIIIFAIILISGLSISEDTVTYYTLIKLIAFTLSGALGGIKGVNKKEKIRIK